MKQNQNPDVSACGADGCSIPSTSDQMKGFDADAQGLELHVISDVICPWCFVGKRRLDEALANIRAEGTNIRVRWLPYELNPGMPREGIERNEYRARKFGSLERSRALDAGVALAGKAEGITFRHDLMQRTPNTIEAHRLIWLADRERVQDAIVEALFEAYFTQGRDVGNREVLIEIAAHSGLNRDLVQTFLEGHDGTDEVKKEIQSAEKMGVHSVPTFAIDGRVLFSGAQPASVMSDVFRRAISISTGPIAPQQS
jgi:predicted DsbA family dithiol-disulfide isomerase